MDIDEFLDQETKVELSKLTKEEVRADKAIMDKVKTIREFIQNKRFNNAEKGYLEVRERYYEFVKEQEKIRSLLKEELLTLNKELVDNLTAMRMELLRRIKVIRGLIERAQTLVVQDNAPAAHDLYLQIKALFANLPDVHDDEKLALENEMVTLYSKLLQIKTRKANRDFKNVHTKLSEQVMKCQQAVQTHNYAEARRLYTEINALYEQLPQGFLYEKSLLHKTILELHDVLIKTAQQGPGKNNAR